MPAGDCPLSVPLLTVIVPRVHLRPGSRSLPGAGVDRYAAYVSAVIVYFLPFLLLLERVM
ncbi:hypothetical protein GCM10010507_09310 [Streptomyces cinnamoneus]|uniref:Uncharacterized protein n=1 Tax=Streptomyces cinnamoneus TaxID=53446 RepID=A0A918TB17_STRCJ|nr:hypothetical protein GCM10010507_09310 [Streptomyces cinnamoneus]